MTKNCIPHFHSPYAPLLYNFVEYKRLEGYKYNGEIKELQRLDRYFISLGIQSPAVSQEMLSAWLSKRETESDKTFSTRNSVYRQLYAYSEKEDGFSLPKPTNAHEKLHGSGFVPYIFTHKEIKSIFVAADNLSTGSTSFQRCAPLLFRLLYGTGLRINEALSLRISDISPGCKILLIRQAKNDNFRLVPMASSLTEHMSNYLEQMNYSEDDYLFQIGSGVPVRKNTAYDWFRECLWKAGIPHKGRGNGPRMHDLRHTFAVHSLQQAVENGTDINAFLPILSTYLGHQRISATERYLRLTAEAYPLIMREIDSTMKDIIPGVADYD